MKACICILCILTAHCICAQDDRRHYDPAQLAEELLPVMDDNINYEEAYENIMQLISNPVNLNKENIDRLRVLNILSDTQIQNIKNYLRENGALTSIYELQVIPEMDMETINRIHYGRH